VSRLCSVLGVSRAGSYGWKQRPASPPAMRDAELSERIGQIHAESRGTYGWPRLAHHGDRGGQYVSLIFGQTARAAGIAVSMGAKACALDNAVCEACFATLKNELTRRRSWPSRRELQTAVFAWIEGRYNRRRLHSTLGYLAPATYQNRTLTDPGASLAASRLAHSPIMIKEKAA
jgi:transposase InsO family protein